MNKLRLLITKECSRNCPGCCNKDWDLDNLPICKSFEGYDEIILTGGEPMRYPDKIIETIFKIRQENKKAKIFMYTVNICIFDIYKILIILDGITLTLHDQYDIEPFLKFNDRINNEKPYKELDRSLRLNIFSGVKIPKEIKLTKWKVKDNIKWIENCPLPKDEVFMRLENI